MSKTIRGDQQQRGRGGRGRGNGRQQQPEQQAAAPEQHEQSVDNTGGTSSEEAKAQQKPRRDRHPVFDRFFGTKEVPGLRYEQQVVAMTAVMDGLEAAAQVRADLLLQRAERIMKEDGGRLNNRGLQREVRLSELATELKAGQRKMTFDDYGLTAEDEETFVLRLIATAKDIPDGPGMGMIRKELDRLLGEVRDHKAWRAKQDDLDRRQQEQQTSYTAPGQGSTLGDVVGEALKTGTAG